MSQNVILTHVESVKSFYVLLEKHFKREKNLQNLLLKTAESGQNNSFVNEFNEGEIYLVQPSNDRAWFRGKILRVKQSVCDVQLVDYGNNFEIQKSKFRTCKNVILRSMPPHVINCTLDFEENQTEDVELFFELLVAHREVLKMAQKGYEIDGKMVVELFTVFRVQNYSVSDFLKSISASCITKSLEGLVKELPTVEISNGDEVHVQTVKSPSEFFISLSNSLEIQELMNTIYRRNPVKFACFVEGSIYAYADEDNNWHRVEILRIQNLNKECKVKFVDSGKEICVNYFELFELHEQFYTIGRLAVPCYLAHIEPITESWTDESCRLLNILFLCKTPVRVEVVGRDVVGRLAVKLFVHYEGQDINVNNAMVQLKLAKHQCEVDPEPYSEDCALNTSAILPAVNVEVGTSPLDFQIKFSEFLRPVKVMETILQGFVRNNVQQVAWKVGDRCLVKCKTSNDNKTAWRRGIVLSVDSKVEVYLLDHREVTKTSPRKLESFADVFRLQNTSFDIKKNLFKAKPAAIEYKQEINEADEENDRKKMLMSYATLVFEEKRKEEEMTERIKSRLEFVEGSTVEIGMYKATLVKTSGKKWTLSNTMNEVTFMALPTNVDDDGTINVYNYYEKDDLDLMNTIINFFFKEASGTCEELQVGDACLAQFNNDKRFYRALIVEKFEKDCNIQFIDYNNFQVTSYNKIIPEIMCWEVPSFACKFKLYDSVPPLESYADLDIEGKIVDLLHDMIVDKPTLVRVEPEDTAKAVKRCSINVAGKNYRTFQKFLGFCRDYLKNENKF